MVDRASPAQQRKALEIANLFVKVGIAFVPMPVANEEEYKALMRQSIAALDSLTRAAEQAEAASQGVDRKGAGE